MLLLVQMSGSFIHGQRMRNNEDEDEDTGRNTGHFQSIVNLDKRALKMVSHYLTGEESCSDTCYN